MFHELRRVTVALCLVTALLAVGAVTRTGVQAQESDGGVPPVVEAEVVRILDEGVRPGPDGTDQRFQLLELRLLGGAEAGGTVHVENGEWSSPAYQRFANGERVLVTTAGAVGEEVEYYIADRVRRRPLGLLFLAFAVLTVLVGRVRGALSLVSMALSMVAIFGFVLPQIVAGRDPIVVVLAASAVVTPATYYLSHGWNAKTHAAILGTLGALLASGVLARYAMDATRLTGYASEEAVFLQTFGVPTLSLRGLLLASIVVGLLGVLDDITISQAAVVSQLRDATPDMPAREVFSRSMDVGMHHIASIVNTLVIVYTSSALPLLLLFRSSQASFAEVINYEVVAEEIVRALVASIGLILAVPITTVIATRLIAPAAPSRGARPAGGDAAPADRPPSADVDRPGAADVRA